MTVSFESYLKSKGYSNNTRTMYKSYAKALLNNTATQDQESITKFFALKTNQSPVARAAIKQFIEYADLEVRVPSMRGRKKQRLIKHLSKEEVAELLDHSPKRIKIGMLLLYQCGMRISELVNIKKDDINFQRMTIRIIGKGNKETIKNIPERTMPLLLEHSKKYKPNEYPFRFPVKYECQRRTWYRLIKKIGRTILNKTVTPHVLRHSHAMRLKEKGIPLEIIQQDLDHSNISTTQVYARVMPEEVIRARKEVFG